MMKTIWIVDGAYLMKASSVRFDYLKLKSQLEIVNGEPFFDAYYLNSTPNPPKDAQDDFHTWIKTASPKGPKMQVKLYGLKTMKVDCSNCGVSVERTVQKGVDVGIATLLIKLAIQNQYDRLILSTGDGDFEDAIDYIKNDLHKEMWIAGFNGSVSADLQSYAHRVIWLDDKAIWDKIKK